MVLIPASGKGPQYANNILVPGGGGIGPSKPGYIQGTADRIPKSTNSGSVLSASTGPSRNTQAPSNPVNNNLTDQLAANAKSGQQSMLDAIQARLDETRRQAQDQIANAQGTRDYLVNFINQRYPELQNRVEQQRTQALNDLTGQATDLQGLYDQANAQARRRAEDAALQNRMSARAGNRLGSSFYDQIVQKNQEGLGQTLGQSDLERIKKLAAIDTQKTTTNQNFNNTINDLNTQKDQATYSAIDQYNKEVQQADALSRAGVLDFGQSQAEAAQNLQSRLDSIAQWAQGMAQQQAALNAQYGSGGGFDTTLGNFAANNSNFLTNNAQTPAVNALQSYRPTGLTLNSTGQDINPNIFGNQGLTLDQIKKNILNGGLALQ